MPECHELYMSLWQIEQRHVAASAFAKLSEVGSAIDSYRIRDVQAFDTSDDMQSSKDTPPPPQARLSSCADTLN